MGYSVKQYICILRILSKYPTPSVDMILQVKLFSKGITPCLDTCSYKCLENQTRKVDWKFLIMQCSI